MTAPAAVGLVLAARTRRTSTKKGMSTYRVRVRILINDTITEAILQAFGRGPRAY